MSPSFSPSYITLYVLSILQNIIHAQPEENFYTFGFGGLSDWTIETQGEGVNWRSSTDSNCNLRLGGGPCLRLDGQAVISRVISTKDYHTIRIQIDMREVGLEDNEWCYVGYRTSSKSWTNVNLLKGNELTVGTTLLDAEFNVPDNNDYNDETTFELRIGNPGNANNDQCYYDTLQVYGIPYTPSPSMDPTKSPIVTNDPSKSPTQSPSNNPSKQPTSSPTSKTPTKSPTSNPSRTPTTIPTSSPSKMPTLQPSSSPSKRPSVAPTNNPSLNPTNQPSQFPTNNPSKNPTSSPTKTFAPTSSPTLSTSGPSKDPTSNPSQSPTNNPSRNPSISPTKNPSTNPSSNPSSNPSKSPSRAPIVEVVEAKPTSSPTNAPTDDPTTSTTKETERPNTYNTEGKLEEGQTNDANASSSVGGLHLDVFIGIIAASICLICCFITLFSVVKRRQKDSKSEDQVTIVVTNGKGSKRINHLMPHGGKMHLNVHSNSYGDIVSKSNDPSGSNGSRSKSPKGGLPTRIRRPSSPMHGHGGTNGHSPRMVEMGNNGNITPMFTSNDHRMFPAQNGQDDIDTDEGDHDDEEKTGMIPDAHVTAGGPDDNEPVGDGVTAITSMVMNADPDNENYDDVNQVKSWVSNPEEFGRMLSDDTLVQSMVMNDILDEMAENKDSKGGGEDKNGYIEVPTHKHKVKSSQEMVMVQGMVMDDIIDELEYGSSTKDDDINEDNDHESDDNVLFDGVHTIQ